MFLAAVLEYLAAEVLELAGEAAHSFKRSRITPRHVQLAVAGDGELSALMQHAIISGGGVAPHIHSALLQPARAKGGGGDKRGDE